MAKAKLLCYSSDGRDNRPAMLYSEVSCKATGYYLAEGHESFGRFVWDGFGG